MQTKPLIRPPTAQLYDEDFVAWADETARLLRERCFDEMDVENLAEEIEAMAKRDRSELGSRLGVVILHLLKWGWPDKRSGSWKSTLVVAW